MTARRVPRLRLSLRGFLGLLTSCSVSALLCAAAPSATVDETLAPVERQVYLMGTRATLVALAPDRSAGLRQLEQMLRVLETTERELSTWRDDSLLSRLNHYPVGQPWHAPAQLCELLKEVSWWHHETGGAFDPAVGALVDAWATRGGGAHPSAARLAEANARTGLRHLAFRWETCAVTRLSEATLHAGAFGKGEALDRVVRQQSTRDSGPWMIDLGGQIVVSGVPATGSWPVAVSHPTRRTETAFELQLAEGSLAVSGGSERDRWVEGVRVGHILDPRSGRPVNRVASVAVWHQRALAADVLATGLYVMGVDEGVAWAEARNVAACFVLPDESGASTRSVRLYPTSAFQRRFPAVTRTPPGSPAVP